MPDYKKLYYKLFNQITSISYQLKEIQKEIKVAQIDTEEVIINDDGNCDIIKFPNNTEE